MLTPTLIYLFSLLPIGSVAKSYEFTFQVVPTNINKHGLVCSISLSLPNVLQLNMLTWSVVRFY